MPGGYQDLADYQTGAVAPLSETERLFTYIPVLTEESTVAVPSRADVELALDALSSEAVQQLRMHLDGYRASNAEISGGTDAVTITPIINRWAIRNRVRLLLGFDAEPRPAGKDALRLFSLPVSRSCAPTEWNV